MIMKYVFNYTDTFNSALPFYKSLDLTVTTDWIVSDFASCSASLSIHPWDACSRSKNIHLSCPPPAAVRGGVEHVLKVEDSVCPKSQTQQDARESAEN